MAMNEPQGPKYLDMVDADEALQAGVPPTPAPGGVVFAQVGKRGLADTAGFAFVLLVAAFGVVAFFLGLVDEFRIVRGFFR